MWKMLEKISSGGVLWSPANEGNMGGGQSSEADDGNESGGKKDVTESSDGGGDEELDDDISSVLSLLADEDEADDELDLPDEDDADDSVTQTEVQTAAAKKLGGVINQQIAAMAIKEEDLPEDMNDRAAVAAFLSEQNKKNATGVVNMIPQILNHALGIIVPKLEKHTEKLVRGSSKKSEALGGIDSLGYTGKDRSAAKTMYERAIGRKMSHKEALAATKKAMIALGGKSNSSSESASKSGYKEGKTALDDVFNF